MVELQIEFFYVFRLFFNDKMRSLEVKTGMWKFIHAKYIDSQLYWKHPRKKFPPISFYKNHDSLGMGSKFYANFQCDVAWCIGTQMPYGEQYYWKYYTLSFIRRSKLKCMAGNLKGSSANCFKSDRASSRIGYKTDSVLFHLISHFNTRNESLLMKKNPEGPMTFDSIHGNFSNLIFLGSGPEGDKVL